MEGLFGNHWHSEMHLSNGLNLQTSAQMSGSTAKCVLEMTANHLLHCFSSPLALGLLAISMWVLGCGRPLAVPSPSPPSRFHSGNLRLWLFLNNRLLLSSRVPAVGGCDGCSVLFFFFNFYFILAYSWLIMLCFNFECTAKWFGYIYIYIYIYIYSFSNSFSM